jgi:cation diffusion facilitator CzcD-associated flavoprotein CzcO
MMVLFYHSFWQAFPFDPNPNWSKFYSDGDEILDYMKRICDKWNLRRDIKFNTRVCGLEWQENEAQWKITLKENGKEREEMADIIISAQGFLKYRHRSTPLLRKLTFPSSWKWPTIEGIHDFKGHKVHSANWDYSFDYSNKRIGIIGNGSSGIQILPQMAKLPGTQIISFQKGPTWITQSLGEALGVGEGEPDPPALDEQVGVEMAEVSSSDDEVGSNFNPRYRKSDKAHFSNPAKHNEYRKMLQHGMNKGFRLFKKDSPQNQKTTEATIQRMRAALNYNEELCEKLIPKWTLGCRRLTPGEGYLESFLLPTVSLTQSPIQRITATGVQTTDAHHEIDVLVCATGFDVSNIPHFPVVGRNGMTLAEKWKDEPESYLSLACPEFPNYFIFTGPNATVGHGTLITSMSWSADWMIKWLRKIASEDIKSVVPKQAATDEFVRYGDEIHKTLTWSGGCSSWYKNHRKDGRVS